MTTVELGDTWLSRDERKLEYYREDCYFWEGLASLRAAAAAAWPRQKP